MEKERKEVLIRAVSTALVELLRAQEELSSNPSLVRPPLLTFSTNPVRITWPDCTDGRVRWDRIFVHGKWSAHLSDRYLPEIIVGILRDKPKSVLCFVSRVQEAVRWCNKVRVKVWRQKGSENGSL